MKPVQVHPEAETEIDAAFNWYWQDSVRAALRFDSELRQTFGLLRRDPSAYSLYLRGTRRALVNRYPYSVIFRELPRKIEIIAVAHAKRRPTYWVKRIRPSK
jgi:plasmid stabilization system protein ParE